MRYYRKPFMLHYTIIIWINCTTICFLRYTTHQRPASLCNGALRYRIYLRPRSLAGVAGEYGPLAPLDNNLFKLPMSYILFMASTMDFCCPSLREGFLRAAMPTSEQTGNNIQSILGIICKHYDTIRILWNLKSLNVVAVSCDFFFCYYFKLRF